MPLYKMLKKFLKRCDLNTSNQVLFSTGKTTVRLCKYSGRRILPEKNLSRIPINAFFCEFFLIVLLLSAQLYVLLSFAAQKPVLMNTPFQASFSLLTPAVLFAGGYGLSTTDTDEIPGLNDFILRKAKSFDVKQFPDSFDKQPLTNPLGLDHLYFLYIIGWLWRLFGVHEFLLVYLYFFMRLCCGLFIYGLCRLGTSRIFSFLTSLLIVTSPAYMDLDISPRDFGKAPFILAFIVVGLWLVLRSHSPWRFLLLSLFTGILLGIGYGVRPDVLICLPMALLVIGVLAKIRARKRPLWHLAGTILLLPSFFFLTRPIFQASALEGNHRLSVHLICIGMLQSIENNLLPADQPYTLMPEGVGGEAPSYSIIKTLAQRNGDSEPLINAYSSEYERFSGKRNTFVFIDPYLFYHGTGYSHYGRVFLFRLIEYFPADFILRAWRATAVLFQLNNIYAASMPNADAFPGSVLSALIKLQRCLTDHTAHFGMAYFITALIGLASVNLPAALIISLFFLWFAGYPSLQYEFRHAFYLSFIPLLALGFCAENVLKISRAVFLNKTVHTSPLSARIALRRAFLFVLLLLVSYALPLTILRAYQHSKVTALAEEIKKSPRSPVEVNISFRDNRVVLSPQKPLQGLAASEGLLPGEVNWTYASLVFDSYGQNIPVTLHYKTDRFFNNFTHSQVLEGCRDTKTGHIEFCFPIYETDNTYSMDMLPVFLQTYPVLREFVHDDTSLAEQNWWRRGKFEGISFPEEYFPFFRGFTEIEAGDSVPILPFLTIPQEMQCLRTHKSGPWEQALSRWKNNTAPEQPALHFDTVWHIKDTFPTAKSWQLPKTPLLPSDSVNMLCNQWAELIHFYPFLKSVAVEDMLNYAGMLKEKGQDWLAEESCKIAQKWADADPYPFMRLGELQEQNNEAEQAITSYYKALLVYPYLPDTAERMDRLVLSLKDHKACADLWKKISAARPDDLFAGMRLGLHYESASLYSEALLAFENVLQYHPDNPDVRLSLVRCFVTLGEPRKALPILKSVLDIQPDYKVLVQQHAAMMAELLSSRGALSEAALFFELAAS